MNLDELDAKAANPFWFCDKCGLMGNAIRSSNAPGLHAKPGQPNVICEYTALVTVSIPPEHLKALVAVTKAAIAHRDCDGTEDEVCDTWQPLFDALKTLSEIP